MGMVLLQAGWRLESTCFSSIQELINHYYSSGEPVTKKSGAVLRQPVMREAWELDMNAITLGEKLGSVCTMCFNLWSIYM